MRVFTDRSGDQINCGSGLSFTRINSVITLKLYAKTLQITFA